MADRQTKGRTGWTGAAERVIDIWALLGGGVLLALVAMNVMSILMNTFGSSFPGDFELTQIGVVTAAFSFLPFCQLHDKNVTADIFTARASERTVSLFKLLASVVALLFAALLLWRMFYGMLDQREYDYTTAILQIPIWKAFISILISLALLVVASLITFLENSRTLLGGATYD